ncbi:LOW QUALITY PROTEIN: cell division cycle-associated protein 4, partial [Diretmus argenteus]
QRELVLGLGLEKLQRCQDGVELSLRRSVLLINTLRRIQEDMSGDVPDGSDSRLLRDAIVEDVPVTCPGCAEGDREGSPGQTKAPPAAVSDAANAMGYLSDRLDDIFEDIDTSMYEASDLISFWPVGVSFWGDEDGKACSAGHASTATLQSCLMDSNELDHIMEILVQS